MINPRVDSWILVFDAAHLGIKPIPYRKPKPARRTIKDNEFD